MLIKLSKDVSIIHAMMLKAFDEYKNDVAPSSALDETMDTISNELAGGALAYVGYFDGRAIASVRFMVKNDVLYFYRLSVDPKHQGKGFAKEFLRSLESYAQAHDIQEIQCKVRMNVPRNIRLYESVGYKIVHKEIVMKSSGEQIKTATMSKFLSGN